LLLQSLLFLLQAAGPAFLHTIPAGLELVALHDRPEGSRLGSYYYLIETENRNGITEKQLRTINAIPEVRCLGSFNVMEKQSGTQ